MNSTYFSFNSSLSKKLYYFLLLFIFSSTFLLQSCSNKSCVRDQHSLDQNEIIKTDALNLMKRAGKDYSTMSDQVNEFKGRVDDLLAHEKGRCEMNTPTVKMWETLMDPSQNLLGGFFSKWQNEGTLNGTFIKEMAGQVSKNFDKIIKLEKKKKKA